MKRQFAVRGRLVIYLEQADINALTALARENGRTLVEWVRSVLIAQLKPPVRDYYVPQSNAEAFELANPLGLSRLPAPPALREARTRPAALRPLHWEENREKSDKEV